ncbi:MAG: 4-hydroxy-tetrahydrodipicolinate reductase [Burkholderiaceae bacterium]|nr:4-hydroxy-tetrahydrodipicolinate reductase [Burkholderiaceae bacterium]
MRGSVAFRPLLFSSSACVTGAIPPRLRPFVSRCSALSCARWRRRPRRPAASGAPLESAADHSQCGKALFAVPGRPFRARHASLCPPRAAGAAPVAGARRLRFAPAQRQLHGRHHAVPHRHRAGQRRHEGADGARAPGADAAAGARHPRHAADRRPLPRAALGLPVHAAPARRRAAAAQRHRQLRRRPGEVGAGARRPADRARVRRLDQPLQGPSRAAAGAERGRARRAAAAQAPRSAGGRADRRRAHLSAAGAAVTAAASPSQASVGRLAIAIAGASGRMGRMLIDAVLGSADCRLAGALDVPTSPLVGQDAAAVSSVAGGRPTGVAITADLKRGLAGAQVLIDFTRPEGTMAHLAACRELGVRAVVGTTGFTPEQKAAIGAHAEHVALVMAPNMSVGVNVMLRLVEQAARLLGDSYDLEVTEIHHKHKIDAPSGTALALGEALARARGVTLADAGVFTRHGHTGERRAGTIGFATVRGGDIVGDHTVLYCGPGERLEITHRSASRVNYAEGSLRAARFVAGRAKGLFGMADVLGLN